MGERTDGFMPARHGNKVERWWFDGAMVTVTFVRCQVKRTEHRRVVSAQAG